MIFTLCCCLGLLHWCCCLYAGSSAAVCSLSCLYLFLPDASEAIDRCPLRPSPLHTPTLQALTPRGRRVELRETPEVAWLAQAFGIYREAVAAGVKPSMRMLNRVLMCLRVAWEGGHPDTNADAEAGMPAESLLHHQHPSQLGSFGARGASAAGGDGLAGGSLAVPKQEKIGVESVYHVQAVSILEEAIIRWVRLCDGWGSRGQCDG